MSAAARVAAAQWLKPASGGLVVVPGRPLAELLREALTHVVPALQAATPADER